MNEDGSVSLLSHFNIVLSEIDRRYQQQIDDLRKMLDERYVTQVKAVEAAFLAQQTAMQAALFAAEKAVTKAEIAAEKRFDAVNEFRAAYGDIIAAQMPRTEAEQRMQALTEKVDDLKNASTKVTSHREGMSDSGRLLVSIISTVAAAVLIVGFFLALRPR